MTGLTGLTDPGAVAVVMTVMLALVIAYTIMGGMVSVVITDYIQFVVLSFGMILTCGMAVYALGWPTIVETVAAVHGESGFNPLLEGSGFGPSYIMWMIFTRASCPAPYGRPRSCAPAPPKAWKWSAGCTGGLPSVFSSGS